MENDNCLLEEFNLISKSAWKGSFKSPFRWDKSQRKLTVRRKSLLVALSVFAVTISSFAGELLKIWIHAKTLHKQYNGNQISVLMFMTGTCMLVCGGSMQAYKKSDLVSVLFTELAKLGHLKEQNANVMTKLGKMTCRAIRLSTVTPMPWLVATICVVLPNFQTNVLLFYPVKLFILVLQPVQENMGLGGRVLHRLTIFIVNLVLWDINVKMWGTIIAEIVIGCVGLYNGIRKMHRNVLLKQQSKLLSSYREIQILTTIFNRMASTLLVYLLMAVFNSQIVGALNLTRKADNAAGSLIKVFYALVAINTIIAIILIYGFCAEVYDSSRKLLINWRFSRINASRFKGQALEKAMRSLPILKVKFGSTNFIEKMTPIYFQSFAIARFIDCMLLMKT